MQVSAMLSVFFEMTDFDRHIVGLFEICIC